MKRAASNPRRLAPRAPRLLAALLLACLAPALLADEAPFGLSERVPWTTSRLVGSPEPPLPYTVERIFEKLELKEPMYLADEPDTNFLLVVLRGGDLDRPSRILRFVNQPGVSAAEPYFELPLRVIYSICFDPRYVANRQVYLFSNGPTTDEKNRKNRIARFRVSRDENPRILPESEELLLEWPSAGHDGGDMVFGADGMFYITTGDGSQDSDTFNSGQTLDDLLGSVLRIDVHHPEGDRPYSVPRDNPFVDVPGARGEIWAYGLRNPWRMGIDRHTGHIWVGNNGQDQWETAHLIGRGDNYGWSVYEGSQPFYLQRRRGRTPHVLPTIEHGHAEFRSLTGGIVYYGDALHALSGAYIYGDYSSGRIWAMKHDGQRPLWHRELADTTLAIAAFREVPGGQLAIVDHLGNSIYRLVPAPQSEQAAPFPKLLSETGLFASTVEHQPATGLIPYSVNVPAWADGARAERFLALPSETKIKYQSKNGWQCPDGTALVQTLSLPRGANNPADRVRVETRVLLRQQGEWAGYSYRWNDKQTDASLVEKQGAEIDLAPSGQHWRFPSRSECMTCHSRAAEFVLGLTEAQMNRQHDYGTRSDNQLRALDHIGIFAEPLAKPPAELARHVDPYDESGELEARVRAYLHVNCSACHTAAGGGNAKMELTSATPQSDMNLLAARPQHDTFGIENAMLVAEGNPARSVLVHRLNRRGRGQMPPLVLNQVDKQAVQLLEAWISQLKPQRPFVRAWQMEDLLPALAELSSGRSLDSGAAAFRDSGCAQCHRFAGEGGTVGPDLSGVGKRLQARELLESILLPSKVVADEYANYAIETDDGKIASGRIEREDQRVLVVRNLSSNEAPVEIEKKSIVERHRLSTSNMPAGTVNVLKQEEVLDLLAYLQNGEARAATSRQHPLAPIPDRLVVLTFDDSVKSHFTVAAPILKKYGFSATFFITEGFTFKTNKNDYMTWDEIAQLERLGFEIGNHTRDHLGITAKNANQLEEQLSGIDQSCASAGVKRPMSFAWPGNSFAVEALPALAKHGIRFARRGGRPEFPYEGGRGVAYDPADDHPLLIPSAGDARPDWKLDDLVLAVSQAHDGKIAVLQFHGVPEGEHPWVHTPRERFEEYMKYLSEHGYQVIAMRDLARYVDPTKMPADPRAVMERRIKASSQ